MSETLRKARRTMLTFDVKRHIPRTLASAEAAALAADLVWAFGTAFFERGTSPGRGTRAGTRPAEQSAGYRTAARTVSEAREICHDIG